MLRKIRKCLSLFLVFCMVFSMTSFGVYADEIETENIPTEETAETDLQDEAEEVSDQEKQAETQNQETVETGEESGISEDISNTENEDGFSETAEEVQEEEPTALSEAEEEEPITVQALRSARSTSSDDFYRIVHVDAGRKYFSPDNLKAIIDTAAGAGYNQVEIYLSDNQGFRLALDDMRVSTSTGNTYDLTSALGDGYSDGSKYPDGSNKYLTQSEMTEIISYAKSKNIEIVPCINVPGHMGAILQAFPEFRYSSSKSSIDLENTEAVAFALAVTEKYASYFESQGVKFYNIGADEYANDLSSMGFTGLYNSGKYQKFVDFLNNAAQVVINHGMTPRAFNDGIYFNNDTKYAVNKAIQVCYWSSGWNGYKLASAQTIANQGHAMINTHGDYYWVLGNSSWQCSAEKAGQFNYQSFQGGTIDNPAGAMFCIWCDNGSVDGQDDGANVASKTADVIKAFGATLPGAESNEKTVSCAEGNVSVTAQGLTSLTCGEAEAPEIEGARNIKAYDMAPMAGDAEYTGEAVVAVKVPEGWNTSNMGAFVVESNGVVTKIEGTYADGVYTYTAPHFSVGGIYDVAPAADVEVTEEETVTVTVGQTATATIEGSDYSGNVDETELNKGIASVSASYAEVPGGNGELEKASSVTNGGKYIISDGNGNYLQLSNGKLYNTENVAEATEWIISGSESELKIQSGNYYITNNNNSLAVSEKDSSNTWSYSAGAGFSYTVSNWWGTTNYYMAYGGYWGSEWTVTSSMNNYKYGAAYTVTSTEPIPTTIVTFTGVSKGTTYVTVGNTRYTINVIEEDLSVVTPLTVEYWITNRQVTANGATSGTIKATASGVYSEAGAEFSSLVPATGAQDSNVMVFWKGTRLASDNKQTSASGVDKTKSGTDFTYIRYWNNAWAYSSDGQTWTNVESGDQIVAYYLQKTDVTDEVETQVVDWGVVPSTSYSSTNFVLLDFAVKYESGERTPSSFPVSGKTMAFHCDPGDRTTVHQYNNGNSSTWYNNYRDIGMIRAEETADYEVYMITVTPTNDNRTTPVAENANSATSYSYSGTEKVVWVDDEANLGAFADKSLHYTSISGEINYSVGGEPIVPGLEIFNRHGMLVTYYVRAKVTEDSLAVHYIDQTANQEFYNYNVAVKSGTVFDENIGLANPWKANLANGSVTNLQGKTQTVSADLSTMPAIGAQYRYSDYTCVSVVRSENGKDVYLYYTFNNIHSFVVDFGLPLNFNVSDLVDGTWTNASISGAQYGTATASTTEISYTPEKVLTGIETLRLTLSDGEETITHLIYIYPATTVYYEEGFATLSGFSGGSKGTGSQAAEQTGKHDNNYGKDSKYSSEASGASNGTQATSTEIGDTAEFAFKGTGVDIYTNSNTTTGRMMVQVKNGTSTVKLVQVETAMKNGETLVTEGQDVTAYNVPIVSLDLGSYADYNVKMTHIKSGTAADTGVNFDGFRVYNTLGSTADEIYSKDSEAAPAFVELRDSVLLVGLNAGANDSQQYASQVASEVMKQVYDKTETIKALVFSPGLTNADANSVTDLIDNGPKNEIYLRKGEALVFSTNSNAANIQIGLKALNGTATYTINNTQASITSSTDMFYSINSGEVIVTNTGDHILAVTKLKLFNTTASASLNAVSEVQLTRALMSLGYSEPSTDPQEPEKVYADASLTVSVNSADGAQLASTAIAANGISGEIHTFTAADVQTAVAGLALPEGYSLDEAVYTDVEVEYGSDDSVSFTASKASDEEQKPTPEPNPAKDLINKIFSSIRDLLRKIFR